MITNVHGLPEELVPAIIKWADRKSPQDPDYYRVTELLEPAQLVVLKRRYKDQLDVDVADLINAFKGSAIHALLSQYDETDVLKEEKLSIALDGREVVGVPDYFSGSGTLADFKSCKVWKYIYNDFADWTEQLNIYKLMLSRHGFEVKKLGVVAIFDDWTRAKAEADPGYPPAVSLWIPIVKMEDEAIERMVLDKIAKLDRARKCRDDKLPPCTPLEMWEEPTIYKVKKAGNKTAYKNFPNNRLGAEKLAKEMIKKTGAYYAVEEHRGVRKRCEFYCPVAKVCIQNAEYQKNKQNSSEASEGVANGNIQETAPDGIG